MSLPPGTQTDDVQADYAGGVLTVSMPTSRKSAPQPVPVRQLPVE